jgi:hypothetical protein
MLRDRARWVLEHLTTLEALEKNNFNYWATRRIHAVHPLTGVSLCSHGRSIKYYSHGTAVGTVTCTRCLKAIAYLRYVAEGE